jgi:hypothetical protein
MMKNGNSDDKLGDSNKTGGTKPRKIASPPMVGVGRVCHLSFLGSAVQPHRVARRFTKGTHKSVTKNALPGTRRRILIAHAEFIESAPLIVALNS